VTSLETTLSRTASGKIQQCSV